MEFEASEFELSGETSHRRLGQAIDCPHCGKPTQIYMNKVEFSAPPTHQPTGSSQMMACADCGGQISRKSIICPHCGKFINLPFRLVWHAVVYSIFAFAIFDVLRLLIDEIFKAFSS